MLCVHVTANRPAIVTTPAEVGDFTTEPIMQIDGLLSLFESTDAVGYWAAQQGVALAAA